METEREGVAARLARTINGIANTDLRFQGDEAFISKSGMSSLQSVHFVLKVGEEFGFRFGEDKDDFQSLMSFEAMVGLILGKRKGAGVPSPSAKSGAPMSREEGLSGKPRGGRDGEAFRLETGKGFPLKATRFGDGDGRILLALPFGTKPTFLGEFISELTSMGTVICWESRLILEESAGIPDRELEWSRIVRDFHILDREFGLKGSRLIGYCSGASVALSVSALPGSDFLKRVLVSGAYGFDSHTCPETQYQVDMRMLTENASLSLESAEFIFNTYLSGNNSLVDADGEFGEEIVRPYRNASAFYKFSKSYQALVNSGIPEGIGDSRAETLIIAGKRDVQMHYESSKRIGGLISNGRLVVGDTWDHYELPRGTHGMMEPVLEFLKG